MKELKIIISLALIVLISVGCAKTYHAPKPVWNFEAPKHWDKITGKENTVGYVNDDLGMVIMVNATCDRYQKTPLKVLTRNLFIGMEDRVILKKEDSTLGGHDAFHIIMLATMVDEEGDKLGRVKVSAYTAKVDQCVYDVAYAATLDTYDRGMAEFQKFLDNFKPGQSFNEARLH